MIFVFGLNISRDLGGEHVCLLKIKWCCFMVSQSKRLLSKGLKQVGPLSPFFFLLMAEGLSGLINRIVELIILELDPLILLYPI